MTPVFAARKRAEEFAALVEDLSTSRADDARYAELLDVVAAMRETPAPEARPEFVADLRAQLMAEAETALVPADTSRLTLPPRKPARERRIAAAVGGLALVGATTSVAMAAQSALPGDALYPVKRAIESVQTGLSVDEGQKGSTMLGNAGDRLAEVEELSQSGDPQDSVVIADTLNDFTDQTVQASDLLISDYEQTGDQADIDQLRDFTSRSLDQLTALESTVPADARDELMHAAQVLIAVDGAAQQACPSCDGSGITKVPPMFTPTSTSHVIPGGRHGDGSRSGHDANSKHGATQGDGGSGLPDVDAGDLPPGSVLDPSGSSGGGSDQTTDPLSDPIGSLTDGLTGGGSDATSSQSGGSDVGGTVDKVKKGVDDILTGATDTVDNTLP